LRPRAGKAHVMHCLSLYAQCMNERAKGEEAASGELIPWVESFLPSSSLVVLLSDCLLVDIDGLIERLAALAGEHDVLVVMVDARPVFALPPVSAGWLEICDVETGVTRTVSHADAAALIERIEEWQDEVVRHARSRSLDIVRVGAGRWEMEEALSTCFARRRLRKMRG
jgi:hypothetical protein